MENYLPNFTDFSESLKKFGKICWNLVNVAKIFQVLKQIWQNICLWQIFLSRISLNLANNLFPVYSSIFKKDQVGTSENCHQSFGKVKKKFGWQHTNVGYLLKAKLREKTRSGVSGRHDCISPFTFAVLKPQNNSSSKNLTSPRILLDLH